MLGQARGGDRAALARLLSLAERGGDHGRALAQALAGDGGVADGTWCIGVTGAPGAGKSTLTAKLIEAIRVRDQRVAVLAVDPSSPLSQGALLGDRLRMQASATDDGVFIRSLASRGQSGGLSRATKDCFRVFAAAGWPWVVIETVGIGQVEVDIAGMADTVLVVVNPGWGDEVQANKAGLMEVADIFVINKADRAGAKQTRRDLEAMIMHMPDDRARPPILETVATSGDGVDALLQAIDQHRQDAIASGAATERRQTRLRNHLLDAVSARLDDALKDLSADPLFAAAMERLVAGDSDVGREAEGLAAALAKRLAP